MIFIPYLLYSILHMGDLVCVAMTAVSGHRCSARFSFLKV